MTLCPLCQNEGWVCEDHPDKPWHGGAGCCGAAGEPCRCNTYKPPWHHPGSGVQAGEGARERP